MYIFHDLDLGERLAGLDMLSILHCEFNTLSGTGRSQLSWVVFLLEQASHAIHAQSRRSDFFFL